MSLAATAAPRPVKLPLGTTIRLAYATFFDGINEVLRISWVWLVACALLSAMSNWLKISHAVEILRRGIVVVGTPLESWVVDFAFLAAFLLAGVSIAVAWHRVLILHETPPPSGSNIASGRVWRYLGMALLITLLASIPGLAVIVLVFLTSWGGLVIGVFVILVLAMLIGGRLSMLLPSHAVDDHPLTLTEAWQLTRGNSWRLFWGYLACTVPPVVLAQLIFLFVIGLPNATKASDPAFVIEMAAIGTVYTLYYILIMPLAVGFLSHAYRHFTGRA